MALTTDQEEKVKALEAFLQTGKSYKIIIGIHSTLSELMEMKKGLMKDIKTLTKDKLVTYKLVFKDFVLLIDLDTKMEIGLGYLRFVGKYTLELRHENN